MAGPDGSRGDEALEVELTRVAAMIARAEAADAPVVSPSPPTAHRGLARLAACFALDALERDLLLVGLAVELRPALARAMDRLTGRGDGRPTVAALMAMFDEPTAPSDVVIRALSPTNHLARYALIELIGDGVTPARAFRVPSEVWPRLIELSVELPFAILPRASTSLADATLAPTTRAATMEIVTRAASDRSRALIIVAGDAETGPEVLAAAIAGELGLSSLLVPAADLEVDDRRRAVARDALWLGTAIIVQGVPTAAALVRLAQQVGVPLLVTTDASPPATLHAAPMRWRGDLVIDELSADDRLACWRRHLAGMAMAADVDLARHAAHHRFGAARIAALAARVRERVTTRRGVITIDDLRTALRHGSGRPNTLAQRLDGEYRLEDVVVPPSTRRELELACAWARIGASALTGAVAGAPLRARGGLVALFYGPPGTGKTLAARAIAGELNVDLLRIDLSQVVNKYVGETEKNLDRVFVEAEATGALLFFDEADALFGKRTEVKDAHDRYANIETAFLLQRLESHRGVCILASNLRQNLDEAFSRRLQIIAEFILPGADDRAKIWARHLVRDQLAAEVDLDAIAARFALAGGEISNAAATAVVLAAADGVAVGMRHLIIGVWREIKKSGRLTSAEDFGPWRDIVLGLDRRA